MTVPIILEAIGLAVAVLALGIGIPVFVAWGLTLRGTALHCLNGATFVLLVVVLAWALSVNR